MTVKAVRNILPVGNPFYNAVFRPELFHLQPAEILRRCAVDRIEPSVLLFELRYLIIDILHHFQRKTAVLYQ